MSSVIRKVLGYGLSDLKAHDPRVNWDSPLLDFTAAPTFTDFADHLDGVRGREFSWLEPADCVRQLGQAHPARGLDDCVAYNAETGSSEVLVLVPPSQAGDWLRTNDTFDYIEAHFGDEPNTDPGIRELRIGIAPFDGLWMDKQTGFELQKVSLFRRLLQSGSATSEQLLAAARKITPIEKLADETDPLFRDAGVAADRLVRLVPAEVRELAAFGDLFTDPGTWTSLVPLHYTYWT